jgi:phage terminase small subunit
MSAAAKSKKPKPLTIKQLVFVNEFLVDKNGAAAAERAGYPAKSAKQMAYKLLQDERIGAAIDKILDVHAMRSSEAVALLADYGRGSIARFLKVGFDGALEFDLSHPEAQGSLHLIREMTQTTTTIAMGESERTERRTTIKLHDAKDAVKEILKLHGRYAPQKHDHTTNGKDLPAGQGPNIYMPDNGR